MDADQTGAPAGIGIRKINRMLITDYADPISAPPQAVFRLEIDFNLDSREVEQLGELLKNNASGANNDNIVRFLEAQLPPDASKWVRRFVRAAFHRTLD
jgi:hypothetical protein